MWSPLPPEFREAGPVLFLSRPFFVTDHARRSMELEIAYLSPHELTPYEGNARKHGAEDIEQIKESIRLDGFNDPIGIWGDRNLIVEGHGRQLAAIELGMDKVPCIRLDHLTDTQRRDYAIRHNRTAELSEWDEAKRKLELAALEMEGMDFSGLRFDAEETDQEAQPVESVALHEKLQIVVDLENEDEMEDLFTRLTEEGYKCRISTL